MIVVSNAGPIIALSRIGRLNLLKLLYGIVHVSTVVKDEICSCSDKPGYYQILSSKWIHVLDVSDNLAAKILMDRLDAGESYSIVLALQLRADVLLIDESLGRRIAESRGLKKTGTLGTIVLAKQMGLIASVTPLLDHLRDDGFRMSGSLYQKVIALAGE
jgi:uncharacterized protein